MSVTTVDPDTLPPEPVYEDAVDLLPEGESQITLNEGIVSFAISEDGTLRLARAAESSIAWPSVKITANKEIDLSETPFLHLSIAMDGGYANGFLHYTTASGETGSIQLSQLVNGVVNDFTSGIDCYVDLAEYLGTAENITITDYTLSVYGNVGDAITWKAFAAAKNITEEPTATTTEAPAATTTASETSSVVDEGDDATTVTTSATQQDSPQTGDTGSVYLLLAAIVAALTAIVTIGVASRKGTAC